MLKGKKKVKIRRWRKEDIPAIIDCHEIAYGDYPDDVEYDQRLHEHMLEAFPEAEDCITITLSTDFPCEAGEVV